MLRFLGYLGFVALSLLFLSLVWAEDGNFGISNIREVLERSQKLSEELKNRLPKPSKEFEEEAQKAVQTFEKRKEEVEKWKEEASKLLTGKGTKELIAPYVSQNLTSSSLGPDEAVLIFISSSVPLSTLKRYAKDLDVLGDPKVVMVMRGFVQGMKYFRPTFEFILSVLKEDPNCDLISQKCKVYDASIYVDPLLFRMLNITAVPAVAYVKGLNIFEPTCEAQDVKGWVVYGDVSLEYALRVLGREAKNPKLESLADVFFRAGSYYENSAKGYLIKGRVK